MKSKPIKITEIKDLEDFYWLKKDLMKFCSIHSISASGSKNELIERIKVYLETGRAQLTCLHKSSFPKDSLSRITPDTLVRNYHNDAKTRDFFIQHVGNNFKFNDYLRKYKKPINVTPNLTYGDLVKGYILSKSKNNLDKEIPKQFEYNKFIKDYFKNHKNANLKQAIKAWKYISDIDGPNTYNYFIKVNVNNK